MTQISILVGGRTYSLSCREGEEARLQILAAHVSRKADDLTESLGQMSEPRMLLMAALLVADELLDYKEKSAAAFSSDTEAALKRIATLTERIETIAANLAKTDTHNNPPAEATRVS